MQAIKYKYKNGIRDCYLNTNADPYKTGENKRSWNPTVPEKRNAWERWLRVYG